MTIKRTIRRRLLDKSDKSMIRHMGQLRIDKKLLSKYIFIHYLDPEVSVTWAQFPYGKE